MIQEDVKAEAKVQPASKSIKEWAEDDRPREKLDRIGPRNLTKAELLAILIGSGTPEVSAVQLMQAVLADCDNSLQKLERRTKEELCKYKGIGEAKAITILAACELARRRAEEKAEELEDMSTPAEVWTYMLPKMRGLVSEEAWVLLLNSNYKLIKAVRISSGGLSETLVDVRLVIREAILNNATAITLCHNHPSGTLRPSDADDHITTQVNKACNVMRLLLSDHVIITEGGYYSYKLNGKL